MKGNMQAALRRVGASNMQAAQEDLLTWEEENDAALPMGEMEIAALEAAGFVVDLVTGEVMTEEEANGYEVKRG